jgi:hypothetical protein
MRVEIGEVASSVQMVEGDSLLDARTLGRIVQAVLEAIDDRALHDGRAAQERAVSGGIARAQAKEG